MPQPMSSTASVPETVPPRAPSVTIVFLVYNRRDELRVSLQRMLHDSDYEPGRVDVIVVDNASSDGSAAMVAAEFPQVQLIVRTENVGVSGWNEGLAAARGDYVLALDDDCFLPPDGLRRAVAAAEAHAADMVSFRVVSTHDPDHVFSEAYMTGLFAFWGCAVLLRRRVVAALGGYDPEIFVWGNELEFTLRFFDRGFRHLHLPEVTAQHMKPAPGPDERFIERAYRLNLRHWGYIAAKLFDPRSAAGALIALLARTVIDGVRTDPGALRAAVDAVAGFSHGLRRRQPLATPGLARFYRLNFETYASPWRLLRPPAQLLRELPRDILAHGPRLQGDPPPGRAQEFFSERALLYPNRCTLLEFSPGPTATVA